MKHFCIILLAISFSLPVFGQFDESLHTLKIANVKHKNNYVAAKQLSGVLSSLLGDSYNIKRKSSLVIQAAIDLGKSHLIEGMDVKAVGKPELRIRIIDKTVKRDTTFVFAKELSASTPAMLGQKLVETFDNDQQAQADFNALIKDFLTKNYADGCMDHFAKVAALRDKKEYRKALIILANMVSASSCAQKAIQEQEAIIAAMDEESCANKMQKAKILVNSSSVYEMRRAIRILLSISPSAPCADEALALSKEIGKKMEGKKNVVTELNEYQQFFLGGNEQWRAYYIDRVLSR